MLDLLNFFYEKECPFAEECFDTYFQSLPKKLDVEQIKENGYCTKMAEALLKQIPERFQWKTEEDLIEKESYLYLLANKPEKALRVRESVVHRKAIKPFLIGMILAIGLVIFTQPNRVLSFYEGAAIEQLSPFYAITLYYMLLGGLASAHQESQIIHKSVQGGNRLLAEKIAKTLGDRLHLNSPLTAVSKREDGSYSLAFQNKQKEIADILILAIPCSVYTDIAFETTVLPIERLEAIKNVQYGTNAKILIPFLKNDLKRTGLLNNRCISFFDPNHQVLILFYIGEASKFSKDTIAETYDKDRSMLEIGYEDFCTNLNPVLAKDESFGTYEGPVGYSWPKDPYAKGSYSYIAPGQEAILTAVQEERGEVVKTLFAPIDQKIYFAGEHASILSKVPGTMEAACESGERVARMIFNTLQTYIPEQVFRQ